MWSSASHAESGRLAPVPFLVFGAAAAKLMLHLVTASRYGYHRDELYFLAAADRPDWGYVDFPPVTPMVLNASRLIFGSSVTSLRVIPAVVGAAVVVLAALTARELGAGAFGQKVAAVGVLAAPAVLGINSVFNTATFDMLWWTLILFSVTRVLRTQEARLWVGVGTVLGVALLTKYTVLVLAVSLGLAFLFTSERKWIGSRWVWLAALLALAIWVPNLLWEHREGWPTLEYLRNQDTSATADTPLTFALEQVLNPGPLAFILLAAGVVYLLHRKDVRPLGITVLAAVALFGVTGGKSYYTAALYPLAFAAAGAATESWVHRRHHPHAPRPILAGLVLAALIPLPIAVPVLPARVVIERELYQYRTDYADMFGWEELVGTVADVYMGLEPDERAHTAVVTRNYGQAGAIDLFGPAAGLPGAFSGHNAYYLWGPPPSNITTVIAVGFQPDVLEARFEDVSRAATIRNAEGVRNIEYGRSVYVCRGLRAPVGDLWRDVKLFTA